MPLTAIAAYAKGNRAIGFEGDIPWHSCGDLHRFKEMTWGGCLIMGRETAESIGFALPGRRIIVMTRDPNWRMKGVETAHNRHEVLTMMTSETNVFVAGGQDIYEQFMPYYTHMLLTEIDVDVKGDRFFPKFEKRDWVPVETSNHDEEPPAVTTLYKRKPHLSKTYI